ncbi:MAG: hypothetical protein II640_07920 [Lachnospiraceae bacterium]|nr:hypothetical protein [Lachnospiraceae bacterium]
MRSFKWIRLPVFCILAALILIAMDYALYPCTFMRNDIHAVTTQTFDDIYMGTSHGKINIDPESVGLQSSRTGHNLCVGGEYPQDCIYMLRLMIEKGHKPERIVYEISPGYLVREKEEGNNYLLFYHEFPISLAKLSYFMHSVAKCNFRTLFFPWYEYPLSYELANIRDTVRTKWEQDYSADRFRTASQEYHDSGFIARYAVDTSTFTTDDLTPTPVSQIVPENMEQLKKLVELCRKEGIRFCAVTTPIPLPNLQAFAQDYREVWDYLGAFFEEEQVPWINFNDTEHFNLFTHDISAFTDMDGHMNEAAARAFSGVLAGQLDSVDPE